MKRFRRLIRGGAVAVCVVAIFVAGLWLGSQGEQWMEVGNSDKIHGAGWILGQGANLNGLPLDRLHLGFGDRLLWPFGSGTDRVSNVSSLDLIIGGPRLRRAEARTGLPLTSLRQEHGLRNAKFVVVWVTPQWEPGWFTPAEVQELLDHGLTPVFMDWYFGDRLLAGDPKVLVQEELAGYAEHSVRFGRYLGQFDGDVLVVIEPELNKPEVESWPAFGSLLREHGIARIRAGAAETNQVTGRRTTLFFGTALTDNGLRDMRQFDARYGTKARGDSYGWTLSRPLLEALRPDLDFIGFQQVISQFHRDGDVLARGVASTREELGLADVPVRIVNYSRYLKEQLGLPILIPYLGFPTATWNDRNGDQVVQSAEVATDGWEHEIGALYAGLRERFAELHEAGVFGMAVMMLFDDPVHDLSGYQHLLQNEYALGLIATSAESGRRGETFGLTLRFKRYGGESYVELLFKPRR
jgi:hypothetical protein